MIVAKTIITLKSYLLINKKLYPKINLAKEINPKRLKNKINPKKYIADKCGEFAKLFLQAHT